MNRLTRYFEEIEAERARRAEAALEDFGHADRSDFRSPALGRRKRPQGGGMVSSGVMMIAGGMLVAAAGIEWLDKNFVIFGVAAVIAGCLYCYLDCRW